MSHLKVIGMEFLTYLRSERMLTINIGLHSLQLPLCLFSIAMWKHKQISDAVLWCLGQGDRSNKPALLNLVNSFMELFLGPGEIIRNLQVLNVRLAIPGIW